jgi:predicted glutamine amidotransferase
MCQLLGLNSDQPIDICFSFTGFKARGGVTDHHADGWGVAFFEGRGVRVLHDPTPSCTSPLADLVCAHPILSTHVVAHIRKATHGEIRLENTHPFLRELWGRHWVFAHNGTVSDFTSELKGRFRPVGQTDSELAFCWLLQRLCDEFGDTEPDQPTLFEAVRRATLEIAPHGPFNFLLSNGVHMYAHSSTKLHYLVRQPPFAQAHLVDQDLTVDFASCDIRAKHTAIIATVPLTDNETWHAMPPGSLWCFANGEVLACAETIPGKPVAGHCP